MTQIEDEIKMKKTKIEELKQELALLDSIRKE
jgi:hypothetical protein